MAVGGRVVVEMIGVVVVEVTEKKTSYQLVNFS
jgi:hypothetical protein